jgi:hypothetical protein
VPRDPAFDASVTHGHHAAPPSIGCGGVSGHDSAAGTSVSVTNTSCQYPVCGPLAVLDIRTVIPVRSSDPGPGRDATTATPTHSNHWAACHTFRIYRYNANFGASALRARGDASWFREATRIRWFLLSTTAPSCSPLFCNSVVSLLPHCSLQSPLGSAVCRRFSLSHPPPRRAPVSRDGTDFVTFEARLTPLVAHVRGALAVDMRPAIDWGVRVGVVAPTAAAQRAALVELYIATSGSTWSSGKTGWQDYATGSDPCDNSWSGVTCSGSSGSANRGV